MRDSYQIRGGYIARRDPEYFEDTSEEIIWQPDVYSEAAELARQIGATTLVDLGCGSGDKLVAFAGEFRTIGVDYGANIERCRSKHPDFEWVEADFDAYPPHAVRDEHAAGAVIICADVVEHLRFPDRLIDAIREALERGALAAVLSTPDRELYYGRDHSGPPPNPTHVREWTSEEFALFLASRKLNPTLGLTRSNTAEFRYRTIFAVVPGVGSESTVAAWWRKRNESGPLRQYEEALSEAERLRSSSDQEIGHLHRELDQIVAAREVEQRSLEDAIARAGAQVARLDEQLGWVAQSRWLRLGRQLRVSRLPSFEELGPSKPHPAHAKSTVIAAPVMSPLPQAVARGAFILLTRGPYEFRHTFREWREGRSRRASQPALSQPGIPGGSQDQVHHPEEAIVASHLPDDAASPEVSIVIPVWNALPYAKECLRSVLRASGRRPFEVIVVDNGSRHDVAEWLNAQAATVPNLRFVRLAKNVGFAKGTNIGCRTARGRNLVILNSDTVVTSGWMDRLVDALDDDGRLGVASPVTNYVGEGIQIDDEARDLRVQGAEAYAASIEGRKEIAYAPERMAFFCVAMRRELFDLLNGFDESFGLGNFEDEDFCFRTQLLGRKLGVVRNSFVFHHGSKTFSENEVSHGAWMVKNLNQYLDKVSRIAAEKPSSSARRSLSSVAPEVSVITRTRNRPEELRSALNSLAHQTFVDFEVIVVNDGGVDVADVLAEYEEMLQVEYIWNEEGHGQAQALNDGLSRARGSYISYLDDDDIVYPFHLASLVFAAQATGDVHPFVYSHYNRALIVRSQAGFVVVERNHPALWEFNRQELLVQNRPAQHTWLHSRSYAEELNGFDSSFTILQDWDFLLRATERTRLTALPRETCEYRIYADLANSVSGRDVALADLRLIYARHSAGSTEVERGRQREMRLLERHVSALRDLEHDVETGAVAKVTATQHHLASTYGFAASGLRR